MKLITSFGLLWIATCISVNSLAQASSFLQELPLLENVEFMTIENNLPLRILREAETRSAGQFNAIILAGNNILLKQNIARYLAQKVNTPIYRIDLARVVSEIFEETQNNFDIIFDAATHQNSILFFDEADALLGIRQDVQDSHDKYNDQGTNYFISLVEQYRIPIIISVTVKNNINPLIFEKFVRFQIP